MTPSELLRTYAQLAEQHPIEMLTDGGRNLQKAYIAFLRSVADAGNSGSEILSDLAPLIARNFVAVSMAFHKGRACVDCIAHQAEFLGDAIAAEVNSHNAHSSDPKGIH